MKTDPIRLLDVIRKTAAAPLTQEKIEQLQREAERAEYIADNTIRDTHGSDSFVTETRARNQRLASQDLPSLPPLPEEADRAGSIPDATGDTPLPWDAVSRHYNDNERKPWFDKLRFSYPIGGEDFRPLQRATIDATAVVDDMLTMDSADLEPFIPMEGAPPLDALAQVARGAVFLKKMQDPEYFDAFVTKHGEDVALPKMADAAVGYRHGLLLLPGSLKPWGKALHDRQGAVDDQLTQWTTPPEKASEMQKYILTKARGIENSVNTSGANGADIDASLATFKDQALRAQEFVDKFTQAREDRQDPDNAAKRAMLRRIDGGETPPTRTDVAPSVTPGASAPVPDNPGVDPAVDSAATVPAAEERVGPPQLPTDPGYYGDDVVLPPEAGVGTPEADTATETTDTVETNRAMTVPEAIISELEERGVELQAKEKQAITAEWENFEAGPDLEGVSDKADFYSKAISDKYVKSRQITEPLTLPSAAARNSERDAVNVALGLPAGAEATMEGDVDIADNILQQLQQQGNTTATSETLGTLVNAEWQKNMASDNPKDRKEFSKDLTARINSNPSVNIKDPYEFAAEQANTAAQQAAAKAASRPWGIGGKEVIVGGVVGPASGYRTHASDYLDPSGNRFYNQETGEASMVPEGGSRWLPDSVNQAILAKTTKDPKERARMIKDMEEQTYGPANVAKMRAQMTTLLEQGKIINDQAKALKRKIDSTDSRDERAPLSHQMAYLKSQWDSLAGQHKRLAVLVNVGERYVAEGGGAGDQPETRAVREQRLAEEQQALIDAGPTANDYTKMASYNIPQTAQQRAAAIQWVQQQGDKYDPYARAKDRNGNPVYEAYPGQRNSPRGWREADIAEKQLATDAETAEYQGWMDEIKKQKEAERLAARGPRPMSPELAELQKNYEAIRQKNAAALLAERQAAQATRDAAVSAANAEATAWGSKDQTVSRPAQFLLPRSRSSVAKPVVVSPGIPADVRTPPGPPTAGARPPGPPPPAGVKPAPPVAGGTENKWWMKRIDGSFPGITLELDKQSAEPVDTGPQKQAQNTITNELLKARVNRRIRETIFARLKAMQKPPMPPQPLQVAGPTTPAPPLPSLVGTVPQKKEEAPVQPPPAAPAAKMPSMATPVNPPPPTRKEVAAPAPPLPTVIPVAGDPSKLPKPPPVQMNSAVKPPAAAQPKPVQPAVSANAESPPPEKKKKVKHTAGERPQNLFRTAGRALGRRLEQAGL